MTARSERGRWSHGALAVLVAVLCGWPQAVRAGTPYPQCVPFARRLSGITLFGDARYWWNRAAGHYDRGNVPQAGSVLSFRPVPNMPLGHVAVVTRVLGTRLIEVDQANWAAPGMVTREVPVLDVSPDNDWTEVRVGLRQYGRFGAVYAANGFIYGNPIEVGPQIVDVTRAVGALHAHDAGGLPVVIEGGRMSPAKVETPPVNALPMPVVIYARTMGTGR